MIRSVWACKGSSTPKEKGTYDESQVPWSGGGGDWPPVPRCIHETVYVCSQAVPHFRRRAFRVTRRCMTGSVIG